MLRLSDQEISQKVFAKRPGLAENLVNHGHKTLLEYSRQFLQHQSDVAPARKQQFIAAIKSETQSVLGGDAAQKLARQLENFYAVCTTDHMGFLNHPYFLNTNLLCALKHQGSALEYWPVLASAGVSLNNSSYPRGLQFHSLNNGRLKLNSFSFSPSAYRQSSVFGHKSLGSDAVKKFRDFLFSRLARSVSKKIILDLVDIYAAIPPEFEFFSQQITWLNHKIFPNFFPPGQKFLNLAYLSLENIAAVLLQHHLKEFTEIHQLLFDAEYTEKVSRMFDGIPGAFSSRENKGSFLFWGLDKHTGRRVRLFYDKDGLSSADGKVLFRLTPEIIAQGLTEGKLMPTNFLSLILIAGYYGVRCLGGFSQTTYLPLMLGKYNELFALPAKREWHPLCGDFIFADIQAGESVSALTGMDIFLYKHLYDFDKFYELSQTITLEQVMSRSMPLFYDILYPEEKLVSQPIGSYAADFSISPKFANVVVNLPVN